jgi:multidrug resistance protein
MMGGDPEKPGTSVSEETLNLERVPSMVEEVFPEQKTEAETKFDNSLYMHLDQGLVGWNDENDPENPLNWSSGKKTVLTALVGTVSALVPMASSMMAPGIALTMSELHETSRTLGSFMITIFILGMAVGPLFLGPLSEIYGRYIVVVLSTWFHIAFMIGCSFAPTFPGLVAMRLFAGVGAAAIMTIAPAVIGDIYPVERRAFGNTIVIFAQSLGPSLGPVCGSFICERLGWRWAYWILLCATGTFTTLLTFLMKESYATAVMMRKTERLRKELKRPELQSQLQIKLNPKQIIRRSLIRPSKLLTRSPIVFLISLYIATLYGIMYLMFTTIPLVFTNIYGWSTELTGLAYLGLGVGMVISLSLLLKGNDAKVVKLRRKNNGIYEPEMRLPQCVYYACLIPFSLLWYGWTAQNRTHWIVPIIGMIP